MPPEAERRFRDLLARRLAGEPVSYLTGEREFWGRPFAVDSRVLIPRPETEHLVEVALALRLPAAPRILDVGTGSGFLAVTLALEIPGSRVVAVDLSPGALAVAARNARRLGAADRVSFLGADLTAALDLSPLRPGGEQSPLRGPRGDPRNLPRGAGFRAPPGALSARRRRRDPGAALRSVHGPALRGTIGGRNRTRTARRRAPARRGLRAGHRRGPGGLCRHPAHRAAAAPARASESERESWKSSTS